VDKDTLELEKLSSEIKKLKAEIEYIKLPFLKKPQFWTVVPSIIVIALSYFGAQITEQHKEITRLQSEQVRLEAKQSEWKLFFYRNSFNQIEKELQLGYLPGYINGIINSTEGSETVDRIINNPTKKSIGKFAYGVAMQVSEQAISKRKELVEERIK
jgi:hypothetical protein